jgi:hypothetical protein
MLKKFRSQETAEQVMYHIICKYSNAQHVFTASSTPICLSLCACVSYKPTYITIAVAAEASYAHCRAVLPPLLLILAAALLLLLRPANQRCTKHS